MGSKELTQWLAFLSLQDEKYKEKVERIMSEDRTQEENTKALQQMLIGLKNGNS